MLPCFECALTSIFPQWVFSCNFGSNSVSMFNISKDDPTKLTLVNTVPTMGDFPISVAYSDYLQQGKP